MAGTTQTLVIGASAAGLATGAELHRRGREFEVVEAEDTVAAPWRRHYDRLHLHTPKSFSGLPGLPMPKSWPRYPGRDQIVEYLELYREHCDIRPHFGETVHRVERSDGTWVTTTSRGTWRSDNVVIATGRARVPVRPTWPGMDRYRGDVLHSSEYRNGEPWRGRPVVGRPRRGADSPLRASLQGPGGTVPEPGWSQQASYGLQVSQRERTSCPAAPGLPGPATRSPRAGGAES